MATSAADSSSRSFSPSGPASGRTEPLPATRVVLPALPLAVWAIAGVVLVVLLLLAGAYGFFPDEMYFVLAGRHLDFGYVDQPPLTPIVSAAMVQLLGASPVSVSRSTTDGSAAPSTRRTTAEGSSANTFAGKGSTENTNDFSGTITSVVTEVLPNGHLLITGEKQIGVNQNVDVLRFSGQVDPRAIQPGNTVASAQIANVRIDHRGKGAQADANGIGWLGRFFLNVLPF